MIAKRLLRVITGCLILTISWMSGGATRLSPPLPSVQQQGQDIDSDILIVGAGISGLSAALEAGQKGARVTVVDLWSTFGGHAVVAGGVLSMVDTPFQKSKGIEDSPDLAYRDFIEWGEDPNKEWVRYYVNNSRHELYDWLTAMGVTFTSIGRNPGNSVPRVHRTTGAGLALVVAIYRECLKYPNVDFIWNHRISSLVNENNRVVGVRAQNLRTGKDLLLRASAVVLATGGFQSNLQMVREFWPHNMQFPEQLLIGSGISAVGSGHALAREAGATLSKMDHQWNYSTGIVDPRYPGSKRGLRTTIPAAIWVNVQGKRFVNESESFRVTLPAVVNQESSSYWAIFDQAGRKQLAVSGTSGWEDPQKVIFEKYPGSVKSAPSIEQLAKEIALPPDALGETISRYNAMVGKGADEDFGRFGPAITELELKVREAHTPAEIRTPPFYAVRSYPLTRKSMGGVSVDLSCRALDRGGRPIPGLYAVGELTGFLDLNGKASLEGTFLGGAMLSGRVGGRAVVADLEQSSHGSPTLHTRSSDAASTPAVRQVKSVDAPGGTAGARPAAVSARTAAENDACLQCHVVPQLVASQRSGFDHFERAHRVVLERGFQCSQCHAELLAVRMDSHRIDRRAQAGNCEFCH